MSERQIVYVVEKWRNDEDVTSLFLSVHSTRESAQAAVTRYMASLYLGGSEKDYSVKSLPLDWTMYEEDV